MSLLEGLKQHSTIVADTGNFEEISKYKPEDATTNPSLILAAMQQDTYKNFVAEYLRTLSSDMNIEDKLLHVLTHFGSKILSIIPGRVSTEVSASLSYDTAGTVAEALKLVSIYEKSGISKSRILIKIASTWEGIQAAKILENEYGIHCNMTLIFSTVQALECAKVGATLISPFVGRITDWHKKNGVSDFFPCDDPGVVSVKSIFDALSKMNSATKVMGASFRYKEQIIELAGLDLITVSPTLLEQLDSATGNVTRKLSKATEKCTFAQKDQSSKDIFYAELQKDKCAWELLASGIEKFETDSTKLRALIFEML